MLFTKGFVTIVQKEVIGLHLAGVVFDFNGTLFLDSPFHEEAWRLIGKNRLGREFSSEEFYRKMNGCGNREILHFLVQDQLTDAQAREIEAEKEALYRKLCLRKSGELHLHKGAEALLNELARRHIPFAIATSSDETNVRFYREQFQLSRWFRPERIVYNDGRFPAKPAPDLYLAAAQQLGVPPAQLIVAEDSVMGLQAAKAAGYGYLYAISAGQKAVLGAALADRVIEDFTQFDRGLLEIGGAEKRRR